MRQSYFVLLLLFSAALRGETIPGEFAGQPPLQTVEVTPVPHLVVRQQPYLDGQGRLVDPRYAGSHHDPVTIPGAASELRYRTPYSYGYFGARPKTHWSQHFGYLRQYNQWTKR